MKGKENVPKSINNRPSMPWIQKKNEWQETCSEKFLCRTFAATIVLVTGTKKKQMRVRFRERVVVEQWNFESGFAYILASDCLCLWGSKSHVKLADFVVEKPDIVFRRLKIISISPWTQAFNDLLGSSTTVPRQRHNIHYLAPNITYTLQTSFLDTVSQL